SNLTSYRRPTDRTRERPPLGNQASMPAQQRRWRDDEGWPNHQRQGATGGEKTGVNDPDRRTSRLPATHRDFVPQPDDLEFLQLARSNAQGEQLKKPPEQ